MPGSRFFLRIPAAQRSPARFTRCGTFAIVCAVIVGALSGGLGDPVGGSFFGRVVQTVTGGKSPTPEDVPQHYLDMLLAYEDKRFFAHNGVDFRALLRAAYLLVRHRQ